MDAGSAGQIAGIDTLPFFLSLLATFISAIIRGLTGFGMAIILVPLLGLVVRPDQAVVVAVMLQLFIGPVGLPNIARTAHRQSALRISAAAVLATPFGVWLLAHTPPDVARVAIALIAIGAFALVILPPRPGHVPGVAATVGTGVAAGVLTGFAAMPGPPVVPYYLRQSLDPSVARASMLLVFFFTAIAAATASGLIGLLDLHIVWLSMLLFPAVLVGNWLGGLAFGRISPPVWRGIVAAILGLAGAGALWRLIQP